MSWNKQEFEDLCRRLGVDPATAADRGVINLNSKTIKNQSSANQVGPSLPPIKPQRVLAAALVKEDKGETKSDPRTAGRVRVEVIVRRVRFCDQDNIVGGCKPLIDGLRAAGIIKEDDTESIELSVEQQKVMWPSQEGTEVILTYPESQTK